MTYSKIINNKHEMLIVYDRHGRVIKSVINNNITKTCKYYKTFSKSYIVHNFTLGNKIDNFVYEFSRKGQILSTKRNGKYVSKFLYNKAGELIKEENFVLNFTITYKYDSDGDIICKEIVDNVTGKTQLTFDFQYKMCGETKQLYKFGESEMFEFKDGFPTLYRNQQITWNPHKQITNMGSTFNFEYDSNNNRLSKTINMQYGNNVCSTKYVYDNNRLIEQYGEEELKFNYCGNNLVGFTFNGKDYFYVKDINNTIIGICDCLGNPVCEYVYYSKGGHYTFIYDNGNLINENDYYNFSSGGLCNKTVAEINPFRYKSYYFDVETGLYYFNGKYYDFDMGMEICCNKI